MNLSASSHEDSSAVRNELRVIVVEDSARDAEIIVRELRRAGFDISWTRVETERDYLEALAAAPDLIISDYSLPHFDGLRALNLLIERGLEIPFILVSGAMGEEQAVQSIQRGADDYLLKDRLTRLGPAVRRAMEVRQARKEQKNNARTYEQLVDLLPVAMFSTDTRGQITQFNEAAVALWGRRPNPDDTFNVALERLDLEGKAIPFSQWPTALALEERRGILGAEHVLVRTDEARRNVLSYTQPVISDDGSLTGSVSLMLDVTELKQAHQALLASQMYAQSTIDSVTAQICVLDETGRIVSVNHAWHEFFWQNHPHPEDSTAYLGSNYLGICETAVGPNSADAAAMAAGIRQVQNGTAEEFTLEYPCHSPTEQRWFQTRVTRFHDASRNIVIAHENITERKQALEVLEASESEQRRLAQRLEEKQITLDTAQRVAKIGSWETDLATNTVSWSDETHRIYETDPATFQPTHQGFLNLVDPADREAVDSAFLRSMDQREAQAIEHRVVLADGRIKHVEERWQVFFDALGAPLQAVGTCQDVTERKQAEIKIARQNRVHAVLSAINALIVRVRHRDELFREACRIAVEQGGFRMAMICILDRVTNQLAVAGSAGKDEATLTAIRNTLASEESASTTLLVKSLRAQVTIVSNDAEVDQRLVLRKRYTDAGVRSLAVLPLIVAGDSVGVLVLYSSEKHFFYEEEMKLLTGLADDVALAIDHIATQERLDYLASYDPLTGLANRTLFLERLAQRMHDAAKKGHRKALVLIDLERFKNINDSLGRPTGDALLLQVAQWLTQQMGDVNRVARIGQDHFAVVLPEESNVGDAALALEAMIDVFLSHPFQLKGDTYRIAAKFGIAMSPDDGTDADVLFKNAEAALKKAKLLRHRSLFYTEKMTEAVAQRLKLETQLRQALENQEFVLHYQPKINLATRRVTSVEALIRWNDPRNDPRTGLVAPGLFIPVLEETGLIYDVGMWALHQAIKDYLRWRAEGLRAVPIAVNVSPLQFRHPGFISALEQLVALDAYAAQGLELELTEGIIMEDTQQAIANLHAIRALGISIAIDDFGTGFSSLGYLSKLPIDTLKIDRMFVTDMTSGPQGLSLVSTIIGLAHSLELNVVAEGVETEEESRLLTLLHCDEMQGYLFCKPIPAAELERKHLMPPPGDALASNSGRQATIKESAMSRQLRAIVSDEGVRAGLMYLNHLTEHRFTALYRFDGDMLHNAVLYDRENPSATTSETIPVVATYCVFVRDSNAPFYCESAADDDRLADHPKRNVIRSYCGVPLRDEDGAMFGTICHFDFAPARISQENLELMEDIAPALRTEIKKMPGLS